MSFTKLDSGIVNSSIWSEPHYVRVLWITMLAMSDSNGFVSCSEPGLIRSANITEQEYITAINILLSPDKYSRTPDNEGRRVEKIDGGWIILNFEKYRTHSEKQKENTRNRVKKHREIKKCNALQPLHSVTGALPSASVSVSSVLNTNTNIYSNPLELAQSIHKSDKFIEAVELFKNGSVENGKKIVPSRMIAVYRKLNQLTEPVAISWLMNSIGYQDVYAPKVEKQPVPKGVKLNAYGEPVVYE